jgi:hypothetical protein
MLLNTEEEPKEEQKSLQRCWYPGLALQDGWEERPRRKQEVAMHRTYLDSCKGSSFPGVQELRRIEVGLGV